ncbi:hypothetical protein ACFSC4_03820 [Deinococcus malanensis]|uniref:hypothetical protein n=1 Tax=Deinococcus malanensis TaxID=1706855 RepID=UPI003639AF11
MPEVLNWLALPLAIFAMIHFPGVMFSSRGRRAKAVARASGLVVLAALLGASWVVHPAAGMLLGFFGSQAFGNWQGRRAALFTGLVAAFVFSALGAGWIMYPLAVMAAFWLLNQGSAGNRRRHREPSAPAGALPEHTSGRVWHFPDVAPSAAQTSPAGTSRRKAQTVQSTAKPVPVNEPASLLAALHQDDRLPGMSVPGSWHWTYGRRRP